MTMNISPSVKTMGLFLLAVILYLSKGVFLISIIGLGIGVLLSPVLDYLQAKLKLKRSLATVIVILGLFSFGFALFGYFGWIVINQGNELIHGMPQFSEKGRALLENTFDRFPWLAQRIQDFDLAGIFQKAGTFLFKGAQASTLAIGGILFAMILGLYLAIGGEYYFNGIIRVFHPSHRDEAKNILSKCAGVGRVWFRAQLFDMAIIGAITTVGLWIVGVKYWALFGLLTAVLGIIPYVGIIIVVCIVSLITLAGDPDKILWVWLVFFITQQLEGNVILPLVMKGQAEIPEAVLIVMMLFFGAWFGLLGVFVAPPLLAVIICLYRNVYLPRIEK